MLIPFSSHPPPAVDVTAGTNFGNMTAQGGLAAAFDGNTTQEYAQSAVRATRPGYVGKTFPSPRRLEKMVATSTSNAGFDSAGVSHIIQIRFYATTGAAPTDAYDGTLLAEISNHDDVVRPATLPLTSSDQSTHFEHAWCTIISQDSGDHTAVAEVVFFGWA